MSTPLPADVEQLSDEELRALLELVIKVYSQRVQALVDDGEPPFPPLRAEGYATATDVMVAVRNMLKVFEIAPFELSMLRY
ncbi:MAG: hypothetical protein GEV07_04205 [Streptosporangiales bacterium]|nr:hypothetical protein [Streptosporangiales bacterium]